jgi:hypothetical protein
MGPTEQRYAAADDMAAWAASNPQRFAPIRIEPPAHPPARVLTPHEACGIARPQPAVLTLSTSALLAEVEEGLAMRVCRQQTTARDVLLVQAMAARLQAATISHALATRSLNREPLDGALWLDIGRAS